MAKGAPKGAKPGVGKGIVVGYGAKGKAFHSVAGFNASKAGHAKNPTPQNQQLAATRRGISQAQEHKGPFPLQPMPGHPSGNPTHVHGPATVGKISGPKAPGAPRGGMPGMK